MSTTKDGTNGNDGENTLGMTRGYIVQSCIAYVDRTYDAATRARIHAGLPAEVKALAGRHNPVDWYPRIHTTAFFRAIALNEPSDDDAYRALFRCGRSIAETATHTFMKQVMKIISPALFTKKVSDLWARDHRGGRLTADAARLDENRLTVHLTDIEGFDYVAPTASGYFCYAFEAMGKTDVECVLTGWSMQKPGPRDVAFDLKWK